MQVDPGMVLTFPADKAPEGLQAGMQVGSYMYIYVSGLIRNCANTVRYVLMYVDLLICRCRCSGCLHHAPIMYHTTRSVIVLDVNESAQGMSTVWGAVV